MTTRTRRATTALAWAALGGGALLAAQAPAAAQAPFLYLQANHPLETECGTLPNTYADALYIYYVGGTVHFQASIDPGTLDPLADGTFELVLEDDNLRLVCDPSSYVLPPGATLAECDPGPGAPADGVFRVEDLTVSGGVATVELQARISALAPTFTPLLVSARFESLRSGVLWSSSRCCDAGLPTVIVAHPPDWGLETELATTLEVADSDAGTVLPGDTLVYTVSPSRKVCDKYYDYYNIVVPLPADVTFGRITECYAYDCWYDPAVHRVFVDGMRPRLAANDPASFEVEVAPTAAAGARLCTQAVTNGWLVSDDPADPLPVARTCIRVGGGAGVSLELRKAVRELGDDDGFLELGEAVQFELEVRNFGLADATDVHLLDVLPAGLEGFDPASVTVTPPSGTNLSAPAPAGVGAGLLELDAIEVLGGHTVTVRFAAVVPDTFGSSLCNQAELASAAASIDLVSDDPTTVAPDDPTCVPVVPPRVRGDGDGARGGGDAHAILADCDVTVLDAGSRHSVALEADGTVAIWGDNKNGQLGDGSRASAALPIHLATPTDVTAIAGGRYHTVALDAAGAVWTWGDNSWGQLGNGTFTDYLAPTPVTGIGGGGARAIAAGYFHSLAVARDGSVWAWGYNREGQLGDGSRATRTSPARVTGLAGVVAVAAGAWHSLAVDGAGDVWAWGDNEGGQLGDGSFTDRLTPVRVTALGGIAQVAAGADHSLARDGFSAWTWGFNYAGQVGDGSRSERSSPFRLPGAFGAVSDVIGGQMFSLVLGSGSMYSWGEGSRGQLAHADAPGGCPCELPDPPTGFPPPTLCPSEVAPTRAAPSFAPNWADVAAGDRFVLARQLDNTVWAWGHNLGGQHGNSTVRCAVVPTPVASTCRPSLGVDPLRPPVALDTCAIGAGNEDGRLEPGERVAIELGIRNDGGVDLAGAPDLRGTLVGPPPAGMTFVAPSVTYTPSALAPGEVASPDGPYVVELAADVACPSEPTLTIEIATDAGSFAIEVPLAIGPCAEQCRPEDCLLALPPITDLSMVRRGTAIDASWTLEPGATEGYRLYRLDLADRIPVADLGTTPRTLECWLLDPSVTDCTAATPVSAPPALGFYQVLGVCGDGLEGPVD